MAEAIVSESDDYQRILKAASLACRAMREAMHNKIIRTSAIEAKWLDRMEKNISWMPENPDELSVNINKTWPGIFIPEEYGL
jgi:hypothetical protein